MFSLSAYVTSLAAEMRGAKNRSKYFSVSRKRKKEKKGREEVTERKKEKERETDEEEERHIRG